ncbi:hypothetical protein H109_05710 [Trichophyton interdigitale MR816]|uniref:Large ribosomal subunit protein mL50 n=1 Tax=Trichophyton interdigitale (strain MR816) TaxID=1215338 RepID=A0A059J4D2_TRIIM|nr:hypothetical protein H101_04110 [Trichophyton interdigitale H6]KDB22352.1 hypothetical protein H109_05710 [Trichophyton interdigitale MR816]
MPSSRPLLRSLEALPSQLNSSRYVCTNCRWQSFPRARNLVSTPSRRYNSSGNLPFTEKVRRKLWGTDNPPGLKDPYGGESILERRARELREAREARADESREVPEESIEAMPEETNAEAMADYTPAINWDGLEHVGSLGEWWEKPPTEMDRFDAFMRREKVTNNNDILAILHQALVELSVLKELNKPLGASCDILEHEPQILSLINKVEILPSKEGSGAALAFPSEDAKAKVYEFFREFDSIPAEEPAASELPSTEPEMDADSEVVSETPSFELSPPASTEFLNISLMSPDMKFAYLKRVSQLTGHFIPDQELASISNVSSVQDFLIRASTPKPTKLAEQLIVEGTFDGIPNVKIYDRRQTPIDSEIETGQWKVIEEELTKRGLPITGRKVA